MSINAKTLAVFIFVALFGGIGATTALGWWQTESTKEPVKFSEGDFEGLPNPADIRGSYTFGDIANNFAISAEVLGEAFGISENPSDFALKELETIYADSELEIGTASVRLFVAFYTGLPFDLNTDMYLPQTASRILYLNSNLTPEQINYLEAHTVKSTETTSPQPASETDASDASETVHMEEDSAYMIKGKTTFGEVLSWGVPEDVIETITGQAIPAAGVKIKDFCADTGLSFETIKEQLQIEVDKNH